MEIFESFGIAPWHFALLPPAAALAGFVDAIGGGGGLISLPAFVMSGLPMHCVLGTNKMTSMMGTAMATWRYAKNGSIRWRFALACAAFSLVGSSIGARIALSIPDDLFRYAMLAVIPLTSIYVLRAKSFGDGSAEPRSPRATFAIGAAVSLVLGTYDGLYGPGTGTFLILLLTGAARLSLAEANGATKVINLASNVAAFAVMFADGSVIVPLGLACGAFNVAGSILGTRLFIRDGAKIVRPIILGVLAIFICKLLYELAPKFLKI